MVGGGPAKGAATALGAEAMVEAVHTKVRAAAALTARMIRMRWEDLNFFNIFTFLSGTKKLGLWITNGTDPTYVNACMTVQ
jgi:hypothetical protein